jgi:DNA repair exonuclease SbcCD ATPase subunit
MASSSDTLEYPVQSRRGVRIRSQEDLDRVIAQVQKREGMLKTMQRKLKVREARLAEAERKHKKRNDFLDAWEVSLKSKEAEVVDERQELEEMKQSLRKIGNDLLALSDKTDSVFEGLPFEEDIFEDYVDEEVPEEKKPILGFLKGKPKKENVEFPRRKSRSKKKRSKAKKATPSKAKQAAPSKPRKTLRDSLMEKRDRLKDADMDSLDDPIEDTSGLDELEELLQGEVFTCPSCNGEVSSDDDNCPGCGVELSWAA